MWPTMILKSGDVITEPSLTERDLSEDESDYEFDYEILSAGSAERWEDTDSQWVSANHITAASSTEGLPVECHPYTKEMQPSTSLTSLQDKIMVGVVTCVEEPEREMKQYENSPFDFEDLDQIMSEIGNVRDNLRLMPDFQRREIAAKLAIKMAAMFGGGSDDGEEI